MTKCEKVTKEKVEKMTKSEKVAKPTWVPIVQKPIDFQKRCKKILKKKKNW